MKYRTLAEGFADAVKKHKIRNALMVDGRVVNYQELHSLSLQLASVLQSGLCATPSPFVGILSSRSLAAFQGILATLLCGKTYMPMDLAMQPERMLEVIEVSACRVFVVDRQGLPVLRKLTEKMPACVFIFPQMTRNEVGFNSEKHLVVCENEFQSFSELLAVNIDEENPAYLLFTSGSTGKPKGVPITHKNICNYLAEVHALYPLTPDDRCSQAFDLTFDPSVHDMFACWFSGACLYVMNERERLGAQYFIKKHGLTVWNTLASIVKLCLQMRSFNNRYLSSLRYLFLNGEPVTESVASALQTRVPESKLVVFYGLTETTVNLAHYLWQPEYSPQQCRHGMLPIGLFFENVHTFLEPYSTANSGQFELCLAGEQVFKGYLGATDNNKVFFQDDHGLRFLKTGDIVELYSDDSAILHLIGRGDDQVKISGHRVDLSYARYLLEQCSGCLDALVLKTEKVDGQPALVGFLKGDYPDVDDIKAQVNQQLVKHMQLDKLLALDSYPYLVSGKVNRKALIALLHEL